MADHTSIEWTDATWNPITGCSVVSPGCTNCYAMKLAGSRLKHHPSRAGLTRDTKAGPVWTGETRLNGEWLDQPLRWKRPRRIFVCAHGDLFAESVPDEWIDKIFAVMALAPQHTFQVLTKRAGRLRQYFSEGRDRRVARRVIDHVIHDPSICKRMVDTIDDTWPVIAEGDPEFPDDLLMRQWPLPNVWLGVSAEDQQRADERVPELLATPAALRFVSAEPLLGPIDFAFIEAATPEGRAHGIKIDALKAPRGLDWIIVGGESGKDARPMHADWARSIRDQCAAANVPFFFKQWGEWEEFYDRDRDDPDWRSTPKVDHQMGLGATRFLNLAGGCGFHGDRLVAVRNIGKKAAGRLLGGIEHNAMPEVAP